MNFRFVGIDLAKNVFQIHGTDEPGQALVRKTVTRAKLLNFAKQLEPTIIGMEACPNMRFVAIKTPEQQAVLLLHRARTGFVKARTASAYRFVAILSEFGLPLPVGIHHVSDRSRDLIEDAANEIPPMCRRLVASLLEHLAQLNARIRDIELQLEGWHRENSTSQRIAEIPGVGLLGATAISASIGSASQFRNGRQLAAWMGLVPRQHSSGGKQRLLGISKRGDAYLRTLLIHGARSILSRLKSRPEAKDCWSMRIANRRSMNTAATALANKTARTIWALVRHEKRYEAGFCPIRPIAVAR